MTTNLQTALRTATIFEDSGVTLMARVNIEDATAAQQADITSISVVVTDLSDESVALASTSLTVANVVFDTLQTDARWGADTTGYNFRYTVAASVLTDPVEYIVEFKWTPATGEVFHTWHKIKALNLRR